MQWVHDMQLSLTGSIKQDIRFCTTRDGVRIAYATTGKGSPIVMMPKWFGHLEYEIKSPVWLHYIKELSRGHQLVRYNPRGSGLSDRIAPEWSFDAWVRDLETVIGAAGLKQFVLLSTSALAGVAVAYAVRHPDRVSHLILSGGFARGWAKRQLGPKEIEERKALVKLIETSWGRENPALRQYMTACAIPEGTIEEQHACDEMQRVSMATENLLRVMDILDSVDVTDVAPKVTCPTLVMNCDKDSVVPFDEGRLLASLIPRARFVPLRSNNHTLLEHEEAWQRWLAEVRDFLPSAVGENRSQRLSALTARELELLELIAKGCDNAQLAVQLELSEKTVRNHITSIFAKLHVENRAQAVILALESGLGGRQSVLTA